MALLSARITLSAGFAHPSVVPPLPEELLELPPELLELPLELLAPLLAVLLAVLLAPLLVVPPTPEAPTLAVELLPVSAAPPPPFKPETSNEHAEATVAAARQRKTLNILFQIIATTFRVLSERRPLRLDHSCSG